MICLIGTSTTTIGFGLCGIKEIYEVTRSMSPEEIMKFVDNSENDLIMIDEDIFEIIKELSKKNKKKTFIKIPSRFRKEDKNLTEDIDELVRDTLGIAIKNKE